VTLNMRKGGKNNVTAGLLSIGVCPQKPALAIVEIRGGLTRIKRNYLEYRLKYLGGVS